VLYMCSRVGLRGRGSVDLQEALACKWVRNGQGIQGTLCGVWPGIQVGSSEPAHLFLC